MDTDNLISFEITQEELDAVLAAVKTIEDVLSPKLITLLKLDRMRVVKMSNKNAEFVKQSYEHMIQNPDLTPKFVNTTEMAKDIKAVEILRTLLNPVEKIRSSLDDSIMQAGAEALTSALGFYKYIKSAKEMNEAGAKVIYESLKKQFARKSADKEEENEN